MHVGHFTEQPWQDPDLMKRAETVGTTDLGISNRAYVPEIGATLYNRYLDEKLFAEEVGFEGLMLNEHHSAPFCMQSVTNVGAAILARQTKKAKIVILGNILPIWDDPLWLVEQLAMIDMISNGRVVSGFVRGTGRESMSHNAPANYNRERFDEAHDFIVKAWTTPGPFRWEGKHYHYRYVNPWAVPVQKPHPPIWIPAVASRETVVWTARHRYPYIMLATTLDITRQMFDLYERTAGELGYTAGPQNLGYLFRVHLEATEEKADEVGRRYTRGVNNPFNTTGNQGGQRPWITAPPGHSSRDNARRRFELFRVMGGGGAPYEDQVKNYAIISGTPKSVMPRIRHVLETLRPGQIFFWDGDGGMTHDDQMRSLVLMSEVIKATREIGKELGLVSAFEVDPATAKPFPAVGAK